MIALAKNDRAMLVRIRNEFWVVVYPWSYNCLNEESERYVLKDALRTFTERYGEPTWVRTFS